MFDLDNRDWQQFDPMVVRVTPLSDDGVPDHQAAAWLSDVPSLWVRVVDVHNRFAGVKVNLGRSAPIPVPVALEWWDLQTANPGGDDQWRHVLMPWLDVDDRGALVAAENSNFGAGPDGDVADWPSTDRAWQWMAVDGPPGLVFEDEDGGFAGWAAPASGVA